MRLRTSLQFLATVLFWGGSWIAIKLELGVTDPGWSAAFRFVLAGLALLLWCRWRGMPIAMPRRCWPFLLAVGLFQFALNFHFVYSAQQYVPSAIPAVAFSVLMVPNALLARILLKSRVTRRFLFGSCLGVGGVVMLFWQQLESGASRAETLLGLTLVVGAVLVSSVVNVMQATPMATSFAPLPGLAWSMLIGALMNGLFSLLASGPPVFDPDPVYWISLVYLGLVAGALTFAAYFDLIRAIGPAQAAWANVLVPILAMLISTVVEDFRWTLPGALGSLLALAGLVIALSKPGWRPPVAGRCSGVS